MLELNTLYMVSSMVVLLSWLISFQVWQEHKDINGTLINLLIPTVMLIGLMIYALYFFNFTNVKASIASQVVFVCSILSIYVLHRFFSISSTVLKIYYVSSLCCLIIFVWYSYAEPNLHNRIFIFNVHKILEGLTLLWVFNNVDSTNHRFAKYVYYCHALIFIGVYSLRSYYIIPLEEAQISSNPWFGIGALITGIISPLFYAIGMSYLCSEKRAKHFSILREKAQQDAELRGLFLSTMSHEIRTPLNGIMGSAQLILSQSSNKSVNSYCEAIINSSESLNLLIGKVLDYARLEQTTDAAVEEDVELSSWLKNVCLLYIPLADQKHITFKLTNTLSKQACYYFDQQSVGQVLINLLGNAIKFTESGNVELSIEVMDTAPLEHTLRFSVTDTGPGIAQSELSKLKEPYVQGDKGKAKGGTGLGLAISERLLNKMNSELKIVSEIGAGSCFSFDINLSLGELSLVEQATKSPEILTGLSVLLIEDQPLNQKIAIEFMAMDQHNVSLASSGHEALEKLSNTVFDVVLLDMNLPDLTGQEVIKTLNLQNHANKHTPILAFTASLSPNEVKEYLSLGVKDIVGKPIKLDKLRYVLYNSQQPTTSQSVQPINDPLFDLSAVKNLSTSFNQDELNGIFDEFIMSLENKLEYCQANYEHDTKETIQTLHRLTNTALQLGFNRFGIALKQTEQDLRNHNLSFHSADLKKLWQESLLRYHHFSKK
jgi:hypothetical protein